MLLTIILLSHNNDDNLLKIIKEFKKQSPNCKLMIVDSNKKRANISNLINENKNISIIYNQNSGIYNSINNAILQISTTHYFVLGLDDQIIYINFNQFLKVLEKTRVDILFAGVIKGGVKLLYLNTERSSILFGPAGTFPSHTGGMAINKDLHKKFGYYSNKFNVTSDLFFISKCLLGNISYELFNNYTANIGADGYSKKYENLSEYESMAIRNNLGANKFLSLLIYIFRLNKRKFKRYFLKIYQLLIKFFYRFISYINHY